jgi:putative hemolysin
MLQSALFRAIAIAVLILANGFFVAAEFALVSTRETRIEQLLAQNRPGARALARLRDRMDDFLPAVQFGVTLASLALGWIGEPALAPLFRRALVVLPHSALYGHAAAAIFSFAVITYLHVLLGELVPKSLALRRAEQLALTVAGPMDVFIRLTRPMVRLMNRSAAGVLRLFRTGLARETGVHSPEELKLIATATRRQGFLPEHQELLIHRAVELNGLAAREIMTPRQNIFSLPSTMLVSDASARIVEEQHSRIPVYDAARGPEHIVGVVYAKDIARLMHFCASGASTHSGAEPNHLRIGQVMRDILVVPETKPVFDLLREFQDRRRHLAIVVDEFGTTVGLVTVEDALEQLVGEMEDEFDVAARRDRDPVPSTITLDGSANLRDLEVQMRWKLPRDGGVETLAGFLLTRLGRIPRGGEQVEYEGRRYTVLEMSGHRICRVRVEPAPAASAGEGAPAREVAGR